MRRVLVSCLLLSLLFLNASAFAQKKKSVGIPQAVAFAQFVYVTSWHGDKFDTRTTVADRQAISKVENAMEVWHKYRVVNRPQDADLMLVVRPGEMGSARVGVGLPPIAGPSGGGIDTGRSTPRGLDTGVDISNVPDDTLMVSTDAKYDASAVSFIWRRSQRNGFQGQKPALVEEFKKAVLEAEQQNKKP